MKTSKNVLMVMFAVASMIFATQVAAQDEEEDESLQISGSVDAYYKYDFSGKANQPTWFMTDQNSMSIGMVNVVLSQTKGKVTFVGDVAFGPRGDGSGDVSGAATAPGSIQNLYVSYAAGEKLSFTAGFMGTFVGYEVISPSANFNYSGSYLFSNGPFQNAGFKADYAISDKVGVMVGAFSSAWDSYTANPSLGMDNIGAQLSVAPVDGWDIYLNYLGGSLFQQWDVTTGYQISDPLYLGLNVSENLNYGGDETGFFGIAGYAQYAITDATSLGVRYENFDDKDTATYSSFTFSLNIVEGPLTIIPEFRFDTADQDVFLDSDAAATDGFSQFGIGLVYSF
ncbi:MAG: outer membrane beta-barrel protein [Cyclobacteriaceae bacterium]